MSKRVRGMGRVLERVRGAKKIKTDLPAGLATPGPSLGSILGRHGVDIAAFCKDFNQRTKEVKQGIPLPTRVTLNPDRSYNLLVHKPPATFYLKQAAGIQRGAMEPGNEVSGKITLKHLYEIAAIKSEDPALKCLSMEEICKKFVGIAHSCGIDIVKELDYKEYGEFLKNRQQIVEEQKKALQKKREDKMLRT
jgi:large subunit ribosomal protein L11